MTGRGEGIGSGLPKPNIVKCKEVDVELGG